MVVVVGGGGGGRGALAGGCKGAGLGTGAGGGGRAGAVVAVELEVVVENWARAAPLTTLPGKEVTVGNAPPVSTRLVAASMKFLKMVAGKDPPFTLRPRTLTILRTLPSG